MKLKALLSAIMASALILSCANIFEDTIANDSSGAAKAEKLELALDARDYDTIINKLQKPDGDYSRLSTREKYLLQVAWLGKTGFNAVDVLSSFFTDDDGDDKTTADILLSSLAASTQSGNASNEVLNEKQEYYKKVIAIKDITDDPDIKTAAGIAASLDTLMSVTRLANALNGGNGDVSFNSEDSNYIGNVFTGNYSNKDDLKDDIDIALAGLGGDGFLNEITGNVDLLNETIAILGGDNNTDIADKMKEYTATLSGGASAESLAAFIWDQWK
jgi:hypothetical protein